MPTHIILSDVSAGNINQERNKNKRRLNLIARSPFVSLFTHKPFIKENYYYHYLFIF